LPTAVLDDFDLDVARGEFLAVMGPTGSGKTKGGVSGRVPF